MAAPLFAGIDMGGTTIACGLVDRTGRVHARRTIRTAQVRDAADLGARLASVCAGWRDGGYRIAGLGVGLPGWVDHAAGHVLRLTNVPWCHDLPLAAELQAATGLPTVLDNDANLMTLAECRLGAARGYRSVIGLTMGTGVGGGLMLDGRLYRGSRFGGGEVGHLSLNPRGPRCVCGGRGCLERYVGRDALVADARRRMARRPRSRAAAEIRRLCTEHGDVLTPRLLSQAAATDNPIAVDLWAAVGERLGSALVLLTNLLNPECFVLGGGIARARRFFLPTARAHLASAAMNRHGAKTPVKAARFGARAGLIGAALMAADAAD